METGYLLKTSGDKIASDNFPIVSLSVATTSFSYYNELLAVCCRRRGWGWWQCGWRMLMSPFIRLSATDPPVSHKRALTDEDIPL